MRQIIRALAFLAMLLPGVAAAQCNSSTPLPVNTVLGRLGITPGPCQAIPFSVLITNLGSVPTTRLINTTAPLAGGGSLAADRTLSITANGITSALLNADVYSTAHTWAGQQTFVAPILGTPASGVATNLTGTAAGLTAGNVTTNANLTGVITSVGNATSITSQTGTGTKFVVDNAPTLITPVLGVATGTSLALGGATLGANALAITGSAAISSTLGSAAHTITSVSASCLVAGPTGATNSALNVDCSTASLAAGLNFTGAVTGGTVRIGVTDPGSNTNLAANAKGSGTFTINDVATGAIILARATTISAALTYGGVTLSNAVTGTGNMVLSSGPTLTGTLTASVGNFSSTLASTAHTITSASASALAVGPNGATNSALNVNASTASLAAGLNITGAATGGTVALSLTDPGANTNLTINAKGSGTIGIGSVSTGAVTITPATTLSGALTYGGVALSNSVTGTGPMVLGTNAALTTPNLGTPSAITLTNATGLPTAGHVNNSVTNAKLAQMAAYTIKANATGSTADPADVSIPALTLKASPVAGDIVLLVDSAASNALKYTTVSALASAGSVASIAGNTGAFTLGVGLTNSTNDLRVSLSTLDNSLGSDVAMNNTANYFVGPTVAQGTSGTWFASGKVTVLDTGGASDVFCKLWDGTTIIDSVYSNLFTANAGSAAPLSGRLANPAGNIRIECRDTTRTTGLIKFNSSGNSKDSTLTVIRIQ